MASDRNVIESAKSRLNFTATSALSGNGSLMGILVAQATGGTLKVADAQGNICNTMPVSAGQYYPMPCAFTGGVTITVGGTIDATVFYGD